MPTAAIAVLLLPALLLCVPAVSVAQCTPLMEQFGGSNTVPEVLVTMPNGDVIFGGGLYYPPPGVTRIARWDGVAWHALGAGLSAYGSSACVDDVLVDANGDIWACGSFDHSGATSLMSVARFDGVAWQSVGANFVRINSQWHSVTTIAVDPRGQRDQRIVLHHRQPVVRRPRSLDRRRCARS